MDTNVTQTSQRVLQPRLFWRRAFAYLIDMTIFEISLAVLALIIPLNFAMPLFQSTQCEELTSGPLVEKVERQWPLKPGETRANEICQITEFLGTSSSLFRSTVLTGNSNGGPVSWRSVSVPLDQNGAPVDGIADPIGPLVGVVLVSLAFAYFSANGRRTLGKKILSIRVVTVDGASPHFGKAFKRELLKFLPFIALVGIDSVVAVTASWQNLDSMIQIARDGTVATSIYALAGGFFATLALLLWWFLPLISWRGQMFYDRLTGCEVRRTRSNGG
ncbi:RDD family protein [Rhizobium bangladeshense]|uniref:RDD family protein n=1 Tax=Rhizobium bangladeshense TaxID=1138189 RepID=UPI0009EEE893|nr:RDD family protein [Rhizobium bangladeshense]